MILPPLVCPGSSMNRVEEMFKVSNALAYLRRKVFKTLYDGCLMTRSFSFCDFLCSIFLLFLSEKNFFYNGQLDPGSTVADHSTREPKIVGSNPYPGPNVIKLFMAVIYEFS